MDIRVNFRPVGDFTLAAHTSGGRCWGIVSTVPYAMNPNGKYHAVRANERVSNPARFDTYDEAEAYILEYIRDNYAP